jgi:uncharacterized damage-inducible protein DinB
MKSRTMLAQWDRLRIVNGIALRCVERLPEGALDSHPIPNMRTPKELVVHLYGQILGAMGEGIVSGEIQTFDEPAAVASIHTRDELLAWCRERWTQADRAMRGLTDAQAAASIKTPWGFDASARSMMDGLHDEFLHHRGQLYAFLRALGAEPPSNWDFENNAPEFQPKPHEQPA